METKCPGTGSSHTIQPNPAGKADKKEGTRVADKKQQRAPVRRFK